MSRTYTLLGRDGRPYESATKGLLGGHRKNKLYGRLDEAAFRKVVLILLLVSGVALVF